jgi:lysophospholipase L1-like esterase
LTDARSRRSRALANGVLFLLSVVVAIALAEIAIRTVHAFAYGLGTRYYYPIVADPKLGWRAVEGFDSRTRKQDAAGAPYEVHLTTDERGFRLFGDLHAARTRFFIIGDSFTHAVDASRDDAYFGVLQKMLPVEVFAYGGGGYGTLQEFLVMDRYIDLIRPDAVIIQFSSNDFANNSVELERRSSDNNSRYRPYLMPDGSVRFAYPARNIVSARLAWIRNWLASHLRIMNEVFRAFDVLESRLLPLFGFAYVDPQIISTNGDVREFRDAVRTTEELFRRIVKRAGGARVFAFSADDPAPYYQAFVAAAQAAGVTVIDTVPRAICGEEQRGACLRAMDRSHWSPAGHRVVADALAAYFLKEGLYVRSR